MTTYTKCFTTIIFVFISFTCCFGQDVTITTQAEMDAFDPSTMVISGYLLIDEGFNSSDPITNLNNLSNLTSIGGYLKIEDNDDLTNINGLSNLTSIGGYLEIQSNDALTNIDVLSNLTAIGGDLEIRGNDALTNISGLSNLTSIGGDFLIDGTASLTNIDGLSNLGSIDGGLWINDNNALTNVDGLSNLAFIGWHLIITDNNAVMNINGLANITSTVGNLIITDNASLLNLDGLSNLTSTGGNLILHDNGALENIDGLSNLASIGANFDITNNDVLTNIDGLSNLGSIGVHFLMQSNYALPNLDGLSSLTSIGGNLRMENTALANIDGLSNLTSVGGILNIYSNSALTNINGLSSLTSASERLEIHWNGALTNIDGLSNMTFINGHLLIESNSNLSNVDGLSNLNYIGEYLEIYSNNALLDIDGLFNLTSIGGDLDIVWNQALTDCCGVQNLISTSGAISGETSLGFNTSPCNNENAILEAVCGLSIKIFNDINQDCINDEIGIANRQLIIQPGDFIGQTDMAGYWSLDYLPSGDYTVTIDTSSTWSPTCPITQSFTVTDTSEETAETISFGLVSTEPCTAPDISIHMPFMRPCFQEQRIYVQACNTNDATGALEDAYVVLELDPLLTPTSSLIPYTDLGNHMYQFDIGTLNPGICSSFWMETTLSCDAELGQGLCMEANLFPAADCVFDDIPNPFPSGTAACETVWDLSSLVVEAYCENDSVFFQITNIGSGDMSCFSPVRIYINGNPIMLDSVQLASGEITIFAFDGNGQSWRLETDQHPLHPGNSQPNAMIEGCGGSIATFLSFVNTMYMDDADPVVDIYCGIVTGSYDPNDKTGFPLGVNESNDILPNQQMEYLIRFQNTGTDTAFTVVIRDTLSTDFDIFSVQSGVSSHAYDFTINDSRAMEWTFNNILLVDSFTNEPGSHGFIKFTVNQIPDLLEQTILENTAAIYFDFNDPIITNTSQHSINYFLSDFVIAVDMKFEACNDNETDLDPTDDTYGISINATPLNEELGETYEVSDGTNNLGTFSYGIDELITLPADGNIYTLTFTDTDDDSYFVEKKVSRIACSNNCELSITDAIVGECNNNGTSSNPTDDTYEVTVNATAINPGISNQFTVSDGINTLETLTYGEGGILTLPADGNIYTLSFSNMDNVCSTEVQVSQESCSTTATIELNEKSLNYSIFPNPTNNNFQINITGNKAALDIHIYNSIGQKILEMEMIENAVVNTNTWAQGMYSVVIYDKNGRMLGVEKVLKIN
jgi:uncharacterized repeat protein (TIGR01451 family)